MKRKIVHADEGVTKLVEQLSAIDDISEGMPSDEVIKAISETMTGHINGVLGILASIEPESNGVAGLTESAISKISSVQWYALMYHYATTALQQMQGRLSYPLMTAVNQFVEDNPEKSKEFIGAKLTRTELADVLYSTSLDTYAALTTIDTILSELSFQPKTGESSPEEVASKTK